MEPQQVVAQFLQLSVDAQRVVAALIAYLDRREAQQYTLDSGAGDEGATILPPLAMSDIPTPTGWSENQTTDDVSHSQGAQAEWDAPDFDFREWRRRIWERPKAQL